jgi:predicted amidophosphoribosyltransferase
MHRPSWLPRLRRRSSTCPECGATMTQIQCEVCGYELVRKTRADIARFKPPA